MAVAAPGRSPANSQAFHRNWRHATWVEKLGDSGFKRLLFCLCRILPRYQNIKCRNQFHVRLVGRLTKVDCHAAIVEK
ncbi:hypothetical protein ACWDXV_30365 [Nocardia nova]